MRALNPALRSYGDAHDDPVVAFHRRRAAADEHRETTTVLDAALLMKKTRQGRAAGPRGRKLVGIFTERDALFRVIAAGRDPATTKVGDVMTPQPQRSIPTSRS